MSDYIKVTISGVFPKDDIAAIADFYGGHGQADKLQYSVSIAQKCLADFLSAPTKSQIAYEASQQKQQLEDKLVRRVEGALSAETEEVNL